MKRFFLLVAVVLALLAVIDLSAGIVGWRALTNVPDTDVSQANANHALLEKTCDVLILGASKASRHYVPELFEEQLGLKTYNGGRDGNDILYSFSVMREMQNRHPLKAVILDITPSQIDGTWRNLFIPEYKCYYRRVPSITSTIDMLSDWKERFKLLSGLYRFNNTIPWLGLSCIRGEIIDNDGYMPLYGSEGFHKVYRENKLGIDVPDAYRSCFVEMTKFCEINGITFIVCYSPSLEVSSPSEISSIKELCDFAGARFVNFNDSETFCSDEGLFKDYYHMNDAGARLFTKLLLSDWAFD